MLTVLNYHRVVPYDENSFHLFKPNVSASPELFAAQMDYVVKNFNVISQSEIIVWLNGGGELPHHAALITFDDGYQDNYQYAYPILRERNLSALIFLTTNFIDQKSPFYWDFVSYCIYNTVRTSMRIPNLGEYVWEDGDRYPVIIKLVNDLKGISEKEKKRIVREIPGILGVEVTGDVFSSLPLTWDQISEMSRAGIDFGAHTINHPILSKVTYDNAVLEIVGSKGRIEEALGSSVWSFAYPNGQIGDFTSETAKIIRENGYELAFSLISGPSSYREVKRERFSIRRIFLSRKDTIPRFAAKLHGLARIGG
jgi:peptidoglycan/xylan/chitin deacetylase (PgdA/CDA1 family)